MRFNWCDKVGTGGLPGVDREAQGYQPTPIVMSTPSITTTATTAANTVDPTDSSTATPEPAAGPEATPTTHSVESATPILGANGQAGGDRSQIRSKQLDHLVVYGVGLAGVFILSAMFLSRIVTIQRLRGRSVQVMYISLSERTTSSVNDDVRETEDNSNRPYSWKTVDGEGEIAGVDCQSLNPRVTF